MISYVIKGPAKAHCSPYFSLAQCSSFVHTCSNACVFTLISEERRSLWRNPDNKYFTQLLMLWRFSYSNKRQDRPGSETLICNKPTFDGFYSDSSRYLFPMRYAAWKVTGSRRVLAFLRLLWAGCRMPWGDSRKLCSLSIHPNRPSC